MSKVHSPKPEPEPITPGVGQTRASSQPAHPYIEDRKLDIKFNVRDLRKSFISPAGERIDVLRGISFSANCGQVVAIVGASGAGKSTLLHLLAGIEEADHGSIVMGDFNIHAASASALARFRNRKLGLVFQFHHLLNDLSAVENVSLPLRMSRKNSAEAELTAQLLLKKSGLAYRANHLVGSLSGGEQQRVAVCRALVTRPIVVLADEPTGNLDETAGNAIALSLISYAHETPAVVIVATHNHSFASLCDRRLMLKDGKLSEI